MSAEEEARLNWRGKCCNPNTPIGLNSPRDGSKGNSGQVKTLPTVRIYFVSPSGAAPAFSHFSGSKPEKGGISKYDTNSSMPQYSWILFPNLEIWIQGSGAIGHVSPRIYFPKLIWKIKSAKIQNWPSIWISWIQPKARGLLFCCLHHRVPDLGDPHDHLST